MKTLNNIVKVVTALAAVAGGIYIVATYGEQIVAWAKKVLSSLPKCPACQNAEPAEEEAPADAEEAPAAEEAAPEAEVTAEEAPAEEAVSVEEVPVEAPAANEPTADDADFAE